MERLTERKASCWIKTKSAKDYTIYTQDWEVIEKLARYEDIGFPPEQVQELKERDTAKKPAFEGDGYDDKGEIIYDTWICPNCEARYEVDYDDYDFCPKCGQRLKWEG